MALLSKAIAGSPPDHKCWAKVSRNATFNDMSAPSTSPKRRSLILAGGGVKVAFQAGVLEVWLEAGLTFDHADGASGGRLSILKAFRFRT